MSLLETGIRRSGYAPPPNGHAVCGVEGAMRTTMAIITTLILERPLCRSCIGDKAGMTATEVRSALAMIGHVLALRYENARCHVCGTAGPLVSLDGPK